MTDDEYEYREANVWEGGKLVPVMIRTRKPKTIPPPPLPSLGTCTRDCPDGECYCGEPMVNDFLFPDGEDY